MSNYDSIFEAIKNSKNYREKAQMTMYIVKNIEQNRKKLKKDDAEALKRFAVNEIPLLLSVIEGAKNYKEKSRVFEYEEALMGIVVNLYASPAEVDPDKMAAIAEVANLIERNRYFENSVDSLFEQETIEENEAEHIVDMVLKMTDEYQKGLIYAGLLHYRNQLDSKLTKEAKEVIAKYIDSQLERYLKTESLSEDELNNLEIACDVCKFFLTDKTPALLAEIMELGKNNIAYYALDSLLTSGKTVSKAVVERLARDLEYADLTYAILEKHSVTRLFPAELTDPVYLAKSNLVHWLVYPTELGKAPDEIEYIGCSAVKKEVFHIFRYRSDSENLSDDLKNQWLIGWSSNEGGTFSHFDKYADYEQKTTEKTVKYITKKLLK